MRRDRSLSWLYRLHRGHQAELLANPHGYVPDSVAPEIPAQTTPARKNEITEFPRRWLLRSSEANLLEDERLRLDLWWGDLSPETRSALVENRAGAVPRQHREAILDLDPGGVQPEADLDISFEMPGLASAYLEMMALRSERIN